MIQLVIFGVASMGILWLSWPSLRDLRSHGFYRFFAFESILGLLALNIEHWLRDPFSVTQIIAWVLLLLSLFLVIHGFYLLRKVGQPEGEFENTTTLVRVGVYRYIRHPLYSSLLLGAWGIFFKDTSWLGGILALAASVFLWATARVEEAENLGKFGVDYAEYMRTTKRFIPFLF
jgi:protein-S-isoprenylcysteine O-methyltransferase Ste14